MSLESVNKKLGLTLTIHHETGLLLLDGEPIYSDGDFWNYPDIIDYVTISRKHERGANNMISTRGPVKIIPTSAELISSWYILMYEDKYFKTMNEYSTLIQLDANYYVVDNEGIRAADYDIIPDMNNCNVCVSFGITVDKIDDEYNYIVSAGDGQYAYNVKIFDYEILEPVARSGAIHLRDRSGNKFNCWFGFGATSRLGFYRIETGECLPIKFANVSLPRTAISVEGVPGDTQLHTVTLKNKKIQFYYKPRGSIAERKLIIHSQTPIID